MKRLWNQRTDISVLKLKYVSTNLATLCRLGILMAVLLLGVARAAESDPFTKIEPPPLTGRWDVTVHDGEREYPSWLEVRLSGYRTLVGSYVGRTGSERPIARVEFDEKTGQFRFVLPPQWERRTNDIVIEGKLMGDALIGETTNDQGKPVRLEGSRALSLNREYQVKWGKSIKLFNGKDLTGWKPRSASATNGWCVENGLLSNKKPGNDLVTEQQFEDFKMYAEFRYPQKSNSGIYLRGRYEVQIEDTYGKEPDSHYIGGVYGFLTPRINAGKKAGEWQTLEITLTGRVITVVLNGEPVIERQAIPGITGGSLDSHEAQPGPIMLQGDHGPIEFRKVILTPAVPPKG